MNIATIGIDLAKNVFQLHGVDSQGKVVLRRQIHRGQMRGLFVNLPPCLIGMEACASAHYWARTLESYGHTVRLIAPHFVKPYVKTHKTDATDAEAICEAVNRPNMRFVPIKSIEQQSALSLHRVRQGFVRARTAQACQIRGLLAEFGLVMPFRVLHLDGRYGEEGAIRADGGPSVRQAGCHGLASANRGGAARPLRARSLF
jgi:transposase